MAIFMVAEMAGAILALRGRGVLAHVLRENVARLEALHHQRANIADHGREPVALFESVRGAYGDRLLPEARVDPADDLILPMQPRETLFKLAIEPHEIIE